MAFENYEDGKFFVGGLSLQTTEESLERYFGQYGEIVNSVVMKHKETGKSKGFGFVTYKDPAVVAILFKAGPHVLDGKTIDAKACTRRNEQREGGNVNSDPLKVYLGGLPLDITKDDIAQAFQRFGEVRDVAIMYDREKQKPRGFGFLTFGTRDALQHACRENFIVINGKQVECKAAKSRDAHPRQPYGGPPQGGRMPQRGSNWQRSREQRQAGGNGSSNSAPNGGYPSRYNAYQQARSYDHQRQNYGSGHQNYNSSQAEYSTPSTGYAATSSTGYAPSAGYAASSSAGYAAASSAGYAAPSSAGYAAPSSAGYASSSSTGYAPSSFGYAATSSAGYAASSSTGYAPSSTGYAPSSTGYAPSSDGYFSTPAQPPSVSQYGYGYDQSESQYGPTKEVQPEDNVYGGNASYKSDGGYVSQGRGQSYHPYK